MIPYTSGSTGEPKGVMNAHRMWLADVRNWAEISDLSPQERFTLLGYPGFASPFARSMAALLNGAAINLHDVREKGVSQLASFLADECITVYHSVPSVFRHFTASLTDRDRFPALRMIHLGGEAIERAAQCYRRSWL